MTPLAGAGSRALLKRLRQVMAEVADSQRRLDEIARVIATNMVAEVCSIYLRRDADTLELCATEGLRPEAVHRTRLKLGQGLVGRIARQAAPLATADAVAEPGFEYRPETGEEIYRSFLGVPIQRLGKIIGVLTVQNAAARDYAEDEIDALEVIAMVIAEMAEAGRLTGGGEGIDLTEREPAFFRAVGASEGVAIGFVHLHEPKLAITDPFVDDVEAERARLAEAMSAMRADVDRMLTSDTVGAAGEHRDVLETYRMFAHDKGWARRLQEAVASGVAAEVAVERVLSDARARMERVANPYMRERLHDLEDLANRLLAKLSGDGERAIPEDAVLVARNIGPGELLDHSGRIAAAVLEEGSVGSHAAIVARALAIPMVVGAAPIVARAESGDRIVVDGDQGAAHLRPDPAVANAYADKIESARAARDQFRALRGAPAASRDGRRVRLSMNAGILADMDHLAESGAEGVGLYRTELQFLIRATMPGREAQARLYSRVLDAAADAPVAFRTLDIGSDKLLPYMRRVEEANPALGWRALRFGLDRPLLLKMQLQALIRGAGARPLRVMFPFVSDGAEFDAAKALLLRARDEAAARGRPVPETLRVGAMLETPSLAYAPDRFFGAVDFLSVGGNDLMQFFFAADRMNEKVRRRYDALSPAFLSFLRAIAARAHDAGLELSFCGEAAGRPVEAIGLAAIGFEALSMRAASIGEVKHAIRAVDLGAAAAEIDAATRRGAPSARPALDALAREAGALL